MTFEFLIMYNPLATQNIKDVLIDYLYDALDEVQDDYDDNTLGGMITLHYKRIKSTDNLTHSQIPIGFSLTLPDEIAFEETIVREFIGNIISSRIISHVVKFEDPLLQLELSKLARTIFVIEMKLRRVLTIIYLNAYTEDDPYELLKDESINPQIDPRVMLVASENEFFHLTFDQYSNLNDRPDPELSELLEFLRTSDSSHYDDFRAEILRVPVENETDAELLSDLKDLVRPIQMMRNCVAHNRRPPERLSENFPTAYSQLESRLDRYLLKCEASNI